MKGPILLILSTIILLSTPLIMAQDIDRNVSPVSVLEDPYTFAPGYEPGITSEPLTPAPEFGEPAVWTEPGYYPANQRIETSAAAITNSGTGHTHSPPDSSLVGTPYTDHRMVPVGEIAPIAEASIFADGYWVIIVNNDPWQTLQIPEGSIVQANLEKIGTFTETVMIPPRSSFRVPVDREAKANLVNIMCGSDKIVSAMIA